MRKTAVILGLISDMLRTYQSHFVTDVGDWAKLNVTVRPKTAKIGYMGFFSDDSSIAAVDYSTGVVTGLKPGTTSLRMNTSGDYDSDPFVGEKYCKVISASAARTIIHRGRRSKL